MKQTLYFYDLETSGFNPRQQRIMQFGGQRVDMNLKPIGEPHNVLIRLHEDVLPDPDAVLVTGITPQKTQTDGMTEAEFLKLFYKEIAVPNTIFVGYNTIRFDDEFMRFLHWRNFYDAYEWQWKDGRGRWDLLDVVRMTRALRPEGIKWPFDSEGRPSNRLELLTSINKLAHEGAHDALSDVKATIDLARLLYAKQPKLFNFLLEMRDKKAIADLVEQQEPFVYTSGKYPSEFEKTTVVARVMPHPDRQGALVYDLRHDPRPFAAMSPRQLVDAWTWRKDRDEAAEPRLPVKNLLYNRCPAVAPLSVLDDASKQRLEIDSKILRVNYKLLQEAQEKFSHNLQAALKLLDARQQEKLFAEPSDVDSQLYDGFLSEADRKLLPGVRSSPPEKLMEAGKRFKDIRSQALLPLYKARNYPRLLTGEERAAWERHCQRKLLEGGEASKLARYFARIKELAGAEHSTKKQQFLLEDLKLYGEQFIPAETV